MSQIAGISPYLGEWVRMKQIHRKACNLPCISKLHKSRIKVSQSIMKENSSLINNSFSFLGKISLYCPNNWAATIKMLALWR